MRSFVRAAVAIAVLGPWPVGHATAAESSQIGGVVHVLQRVPAGDGCDLWTEVGIDVRQAAGDDPGGVTAYMNFGHACGADVETDGQVGAYGHPLDSVTVEFAPSGQRIRVVGQLVADTWPSGQPSVLDVDVTISDPGIQQPRTAGAWAGYATGRVIGPQTLDMASVEWTGLPASPAPPAEWAGASISKSNPTGHVTGPRPIDDPAWRSGGPVGISSGLCGQDETGPHYSQMTVWTRGSVASPRLQALHLRADAGCQFNTIALFFEADAILPDGSLDQNKVTVIAVAPGTDMVLVPSAMRGTGLHDMAVQFVGHGDVIDPCDPTSTVDYFLTSAGLTAQTCP